MANETTEPATTDDAQGGYVAPDVTALGSLHTLTLGGGGDGSDGIDTGSVGPT